MKLWEPRSHQDKRGFAELVKEMVLLCEQPIAEHSSEGRADELFKLIRLNGELQGLAEDSRDALHDSFISLGVYGAELNTIFAHVSAHEYLAYGSAHPRSPRPPLSGRRTESGQEDSEAVHALSVQTSEYEALLELAKV